MRRRLGIIVTIVLALVVLIAINSLSYVSEVDQPDSELAPNRSTYHAGATGTRALYELLCESGYKVMRWRETPPKLLGESGKQVRTFVIVGQTRVSIAEDEARSLLFWVRQGGRLVIIARRPDRHLLPRAGDWQFAAEFLNFPGLESDPADVEQMTQGVKPLYPIQPTPLTRNVGAVMPSQYSSAIKLSVSNREKTDAQTASQDQSTDEDPPPAPVSPADEDVSSSTVSPAPVVHLASAKGAVLLEYPHGQGSITILSDPFIVANRGIGLKDNLQIAINLVARHDGIIAFDEFHHGRGVTRNAFASYFSGTPILAIAGQITLLIILVLWTRGRRFARPLPLPSLDRRSSLEFVASMAELQQRAGALDLAIENVYSRIRRVLARYAGVDYNSTRSEIATRVAARSTLDAHQLETLMRQTEEAINGGAISERQSIQLVKRLREVESSLGLRMRSREVKQSAQNI